MSAGGTARLKLVYLFMVVAAIALRPAPYLLLGLAGLQAALWARAGLGLAPMLRSLRRISLLIVILVISYSVVGLGGAAANAVDYSIFGIRMRIDPAGVETAALMSARVALMIWASLWVQLSEGPGAIARGLRGLGAPKLVSVAIDGALELAAQGGRGAGKGGGGGRGRSRGGRHAAPSANSDAGKNAGPPRAQSEIKLSDLRRGEFGAIRDMLQGVFSNARRFVAERHPDLTRRQAQLLSVALGVTAAIMAAKMLQIAPGLPVAPGHKNIVIVPLFLFAAAAAPQWYSGAFTGLVVGAVSVLLGFGKFGVFEIAHFAAPGVLADLLWPVLRRARADWLRFPMLIAAGAILGAGRFSANLLVIWLAGAPAGAFVLYLPMLGSQILFGALSAFVSMFLLKLLDTENPGGSSMRDRRVDDDRSARERTETIRGAEPAQSQDTKTKEKEISA